MSKADRTNRAGKRFEKQVAEFIGGDRIIRLDYGQSAPDVTLANMMIECKLRGHNIGVRAWLEQAEGYCDTEHIPVAICKEKGKPIGRSMVVMFLSDWRELIGGNHD